MRADGGLRRRRGILTNRIVAPLPLDPFAEGWHCDGDLPGAPPWRRLGPPQASRVETPFARATGILPLQVAHLRSAAWRAGGRGGCRPRHVARSLGPAGRALQGPVARLRRCSSRCESRRVAPFGWEQNRSPSDPDGAGVLPVREREARAVFVCFGRGAQVEVLTSSLAAQCATLSGYGAGSPRTMCRKPASTASAIESRVLVGWS